MIAAVATTTNPKVHQIVFTYGAFSAFLTSDSQFSAFSKISTLSDAFLSYSVLIEVLIASSQSDIYPGYTVSPIMIYGTPPASSPVTVATLLNKVFPEYYDNAF